MNEPDEAETDQELLRRVRAGEWSTITPDMVTRSSDEIIADLAELGLWPIPKEWGNG